MLNTVLKLLDFFEVDLCIVLLYMLYYFVTYFFILSFLSTYNLFNKQSEIEKV